MKNKQIDLHNHLMAQMERLNDENLTGDRLKDEIKRGSAMSSVASQIVANAKLALAAKMSVNEGYLLASELPSMLIDKIPNENE